MIQRTNAFHKSNECSFIFNKCNVVARKSRKIVVRYRIFKTYRDLLFNSLTRGCVLAWLSYSYVELSTVFSTKKKNRVGLLF